MIGYMKMEMQRLPDRQWCKGYGDVNKQFHQCYKLSLISMTLESQAIMYPEWRDTLKCVMVPPQVRTVDSSCVVTLCASYRT